MCALQHARSDGSRGVCACVAGGCGRAHTELVASLVREGSNQRDGGRGRAAEGQRGLLVVRGDTYIPKENERLLCRLTREGAVRGRVDSLRSEVSECSAVRRVVEAEAHLHGEQPGERVVSEGGVGGGCAV
jgi:hypothetical protein